MLFDYFYSTTNTAAATLFYFYATHEASSVSIHLFYLSYSFSRNLYTNHTKILVLWTYCAAATNEESRLKYAEISYSYKCILWWWCRITSYLLWYYTLYSVRVMMGGGGGKWWPHHCLKTYCRPRYIFYSILNVESLFLTLSLFVLP